MKIKRLILKNVRSYKHEEIEFPEGAVLLAGDIGSGKTSLLLAIEYALFGLQPGQRGTSLLRNGASIGQVSLELDIDGRSIVIERRLKRNNKSVTNEFSSITINGIKTESSLTEIKTKILDVLGYPQEFIKKNNLLYRYTVYMQQEQIRQIILEDSEIRLNVLRHILGIDKYRRIRENLIIFLNRLKEDSKLLQGQIKFIEEESSKIKLKNELLRELESKIEDKMQDVQSNIKKRKSAELEVSALKEKIKEKEYYEKEVEKISIFLTSKYEALASLESEISDLKKSISESKEVFNEEDYNNTLIQIFKKNEAIDSLNSHQTTLGSKINSLENSISDSIKKKERIFKIDICPTCLQDVPEAHKHNILNETESLISQLTKQRHMLEKQISEINEFIHKEKLEKEAVEKRRIFLEILKTRSEYLEKMKTKLKNLTKIEENITTDISSAEEKIKLLKNKILEFSIYDELFKSKNAELQKAFELERGSEISLAELKKESELTIREIFELQKIIKIKEISKKKLSNLLEISDWLSSSFLNLIEYAERNVLLKLRQEFSKMFSKWFQMLVPEGPLNVRLDESFSPIAIHNETEMDYSFLSGGERTAIALAYRLALNQTINSVLSKIKTKNIVILDEPTDGFSEMQIERMRSVFEELNVSQLIIVSHEQKIEGLVNNIIRVKKQGNVSTLDYSPILILAQKP